MADIFWEIGEAQQLRAYTRTAPYLDFTDTHAQLPTAEAAIQAATTLWQKWAHTFEAYKQVQQGLPDMFMGKLIPQNAQAHSKTDSRRPAKGATADRATVHFLLARFSEKILHLSHE